MKYEEVIAQIETLSEPAVAKGMARFGITAGNIYGVSMPALREMAGQIGTDHELARSLWSTGIHEAMILATLVEDPDLISEGQMDRWAAEFYSWDLCDQCCINLFRKTNYAYKKAMTWSRREEEFVKRAGYVMMAVLAIHDKLMQDEEFENFFFLIEEGARDERIYVKKAVNWALRQIGKRNRHLNRRALSVAAGIAGLDSKAARWVGRHAQKELGSAKVQKRIQRKE